MAASWVRVRTLSEFVFCPRAGMLSHASEDEEDEPTDERMNLNFLPEYSLTLIEEQLAVHLQRLWQWTAWTATGVLLFGGAWWKGLPAIVPMAIAVPLLICVWKSLCALSAVSTLNDRRREALSAKANEPATDLREDLRVRWWELLKAGFESVSYLEPLRDEEQALVGKPWRVLKKGSLRIPVIRLQPDNYHAGRYWVYDQHRMRLAAYAHLLAVCEGGQTPYGVVLFGGSYEGVAIPISTANLQGVKSKLDELRLCFDSEKLGVPMAVPSDLRICSGCPLGRPRTVTTDDRREEKLGMRLHVVPASDGQTYHSECGDAFRWTPPHQEAKRKKFGTLG